MKTIIILLIACTLSACCQKVKYPVDIKGLTYRNKLSFNNQFKIDGLYYDKEYFSDSSVSISYFFTDGTYCGFSQKDYIDDIKSDRPICCSVNEIRDVPYYWGAYIIKGDTIKVQLVNPHRDAFEKFKIKERWAKIINDTTIHFFKQISPQGKESPYDELLYFKKCTVKPDSTNVLMKY